MSRIKITSEILVTFLISIATARMTSAEPLVFTGNRIGDSLGGAVACSRASVGSHRRSLIVATAPGYGSGRGAVMMYDPEARDGKARKLKMGAPYAGCKFGSSVSFVSDVNGDGVDELVVSASCSKNNRQERFLIFQSVRKGARIGFTLCGTKVEEGGVSRIARHRDGFLVTHVGGDVSSLHGIFMSSSKECSVATATVVSREADGAGHDGVCTLDPSGACVISRGCQAHVGGRLRSLEVRGIPYWKDGTGRVEARTRGALALAAYSTTSDQIGPNPIDTISPELPPNSGSIPLIPIVTSAPDGQGPLTPGSVLWPESDIPSPPSPAVTPGSGDEPAPGAVITPADGDPPTPTIVIAPESASSVVNSSGSVELSGQGVAVAPGSAGLPAPEVLFSNQNMANVILPEVSVRLTEAQRDRALRLLLNRGSSKQKAEKALENPKNFITTYIVTIVAESGAVAARAVMLKARMVNARGATQIRKLRTQPTITTTRPLGSVYP